VFWIYYDTQEMFDQEDKRSWKRSVPKNLATLLKARGAVSLDSADLLAGGVACIAQIEANAAPRTLVGCGWRTITEEGNKPAEIALASKNQKLAGSCRLSGP
jgi:hypothetical protein